jgi:prepilin-type N-terminal cleavage/methylation domain-containing protein
MNGTKKNRGFTLIELMIVFSIIGLLASLILPFMMQARCNALFSVCQSNERNIAAALENYWLDNEHQYPMTNLTPVYDGGWLNKHIWCPSDPTHADYGYATTTDAKIYTLSCVGRHFTGAGTMVPAFYPQYEFGRGVILGP